MKGTHRGMHMIQVVTTVEVLPDCLDDFLSLLNETLTKVQAEDGCLAYEPMVDIATGMPTQVELRPDTITLVEAWANLDSLQAHLQAPHMTRFREAAKEYVKHVSHQCLQPV